MTLDILTMIYESDTEVLENRPLSVFFFFLVYASESLNTEI